MKKSILFDINGTLANIEHRRRLLDSKNPNWAVFTSKMGDDTPNIPIVDLYNTLWQTQKYEMILVSGRNEDSRKMTERWLTWNSIPFGMLLMRSSGDFRADVEIKQEMLDWLLQQGKTIQFVVDDRNSVVEMWRQNGITCLQCGYGNF